VSLLAVPGEPVESSDTSRLTLKVLLRSTRQRMVECPFKGGAVVGAPGVGEMEATVSWCMLFPLVSHVSLPKSSH
jgi:hypothetical protein